MKASARLGLAVIILVILNVNCTDNALANDLPPILSGSLAISPSTTIHFVSPRQIAICKKGCETVVCDYDGKMVIIANKIQKGAAYQDQNKFLEFKVMTGDDERPTYPGVFRIREKKPMHWSKQAQAPMPLSLFFDEGRALHEGDVWNNFREIDKYASRGCVHITRQYIKRIYKWAQENSSLVVVNGWRWEPVEKLLRKRR